MGHVHLLRGGVDAHKQAHVEVHVHAQKRRDVALVAIRVLFDGRQDNPARGTACRHQSILVGDVIVGDTTAAGTLLLEAEDQTLGQDNTGIRHTCCTLAVWIMLLVRCSQSFYAKIKN